MERATGLASTVERTASMAGAALAGVLVATFGGANALLVDAASFGVSAAVLAWATVGLRPVAEPAAGPASRPAGPTRCRTAPSCGRAGPSCAATGYCSASR